MKKEVKKWRVWLDGKEFVVEPYKKRKEWMIAKICFSSAFEKKDGKRTLTFLQEIAWSGIFSKITILFSVLYESEIQEEDAKRFLLESILKYEKEKQNAERFEPDSEAVIQRLEELRKKFKKKERWYKITLCDEVFEVNEFERSSDEDMDAYEEGIEEHNYLGTSMVAYCKKKNLEYWKQEMIKETEKILDSITERSKCHYDETCKENEERKTRLQELMKTLGAPKEPKKLKKLKKTEEEEK